MNPPAGPQRSLAEIAEAVGGRVAGDGTVRVVGVAPASSAGPGDLAFLTHPRYRKAVAACAASAVLCAEEDASLGKPLLVCANPYAALARIVSLFHPPAPLAPGVRPGAHVHASARVDPTAAVFEGVVVGARASVGARCVLHPGVVVEEGACLGEDCVLHANAVVRERCVLGNRVVLQPGAVVGGEGFGFAWDGERYLKIPQVGIAVLEDDVEVGANSCVDRATLGETRVGAGTKIDNLVQIGHNVVVGRHSVFAGQAGVAGSSEIGDYARVGGQAGVSGHVRIGHRVSLATRSGVMEDLPDGGTYWGSPTMPFAEAMKVVAAQRQLPELLRRVRRLEKELRELRRAREGGT